MTTLYIGEVGYDIEEMKLAVNKPEKQEFRVEIKLKREDAVTGKITHKTESLHIKNKKMYTGIINDPMSMVHLFRAFVAQFNLKADLPEGEIKALKKDYPVRKPHHVDQIDRPMWMSIFQMDQFDLFWDMRESLYRYVQYNTQYKSESTKEDRLDVLCTFLWYAISKDDLTFQPETALSYLEKMKDENKSHAYIQKTKKTLSDFLMYKGDPPLEIPVEKPRKNENIMVDPSCIRAMEEYYMEKYKLAIKKPVTDSNFRTIATPIRNLIFFRLMLDHGMSPGAILNYQRADFKHQKGDAVSHLIQSYLNVRDEHLKARRKADKNENLKDTCPYLFINGYYQKLSDRVFTKMFVIDLKNEVLIFQDEHFGKVTPLRLQYNYVHHQLTQMGKKPQELIDSGFVKIAWNVVRDLKKRNKS